MFLSKEAIYKQLLYEFLEYKKLALAPGKPAKHEPKTLLANFLPGSVITNLELAKTRLKSALTIDDIPEEDQTQFNDLFKVFFEYKESIYTKENPFGEYTKTKESDAHPCAWLVFAPLIINSSPCEYKTEQDFIDYLKAPKIGFVFNKNCSIEKTGLYIAVKTNNHEMVNAFLCPEFNNYQPSKEDLVSLLSLTNDIKTRLALFRNCPDLVVWIGSSKKLKENVVNSFEELEELWSILDEPKREQFIQNTSSQLWLKLLDEQLGKQKVVKLIGKDCAALLNKKLAQDRTIQKAEFIPKTLRYLDKKEQFSYLLDSSTALNEEFSTSPNKEQWILLLSSLGYQVNSRGSVTITRYIANKSVSKIHNQLISAIISLPIDKKSIISALHKVEQYVHDPKTQQDYEKYLNQIARKAVRNEYKKGFFLINWFNQLLRYLQIKSESPLHPYINSLTEIIKQEGSVASISGDLLDILPNKNNYKIYNNSVLAYFDGNMKAFWFELPQQDRTAIIKDPIRLERLLHFLSTSKEDYRLKFFEALDPESLSYLGSVKGLKQLILDTSTFNAAQDLPVLIKTMTANSINFLDHVEIAEILAEPNDKLFKQLFNFFPKKELPYENLLFQVEILEALNKIPEEQFSQAFNRFLQVYCADANHFSKLLAEILKEDPAFTEKCWNSVNLETWNKWYVNLQYAKEWKEVLNSLGSLPDRLEFFELLTSGGKLTAEEFCTFLNKNATVVHSIWNKVPAEQWSTWISEYKLPETTLSLLNTMDYSYRVHFFEAMLKMSPKQRDELCIRPNKTLDQFYPEEVKKELAKATTWGGAKAKLTQFKKAKIEAFDEDLNALIKAVNELNLTFDRLRATDVKSHRMYITYAASFFVADPYYKEVDSVNTNLEVAQKLNEDLLKNPLLEIKKEESEIEIQIVGLSVSMARLQQHLLALESESLASDLSGQLKKVKVFLEKGLVKPVATVHEQPVTFNPSHGV